MALFSSKLFNLSLAHVFRSASSRWLSDFKSAQNITNLYPNSDPNAILRKQPEIQSTTEFSGFIPLDEIKISYSYASGPGGQHVNKTKSKVEIRFHVPSASWIPDDVKSAFMKQEAHRITKDNFFIITSDHTRQQILNQADCLERIRRAIRECMASMHQPEKSPEVLEMVQRRQIKATEKRLREKKLASFNKMQRRPPSPHDL